MSRKTAPRPLAECLRAWNGRQGLQARLALHQRLLETLRRQLPPALRPHCLGCVFDRSGVLTLYVDTAARATQLRYLQPRLLPALQAVAPVTRLRTRVLLTPRPVAGRSAPPRVPAPETVARLRRQAAWVADGDVRRSLLRLLDSWEKAGEG